MAKWHINANHQVDKCKAIFRACPYKVHFNSMEDAEAYVDAWDNNRITYPKLVDEDILCPENKYVIEVANIKDKALLDGMNIQEDSFVAIAEEGLDKDRTREILKKFLDECKLKEASLARAIDASKFSHRANMILNRDSSKVDLFDNEEELNQAKQEFFDDLWDDRDALEIVMSFGYTINDKMIDRGTRLRVFNRKEDIEYDFSDLDEVNEIG